MAAIRTHPQGEWAPRPTGIQMSPLELVPVQLSLPLPEVMGTTSVDAVPLPWVGSGSLARLHRRLAERLGEPIDLVGTNNRRTLLSWRRAEEGLLSVRMQRQFALADDSVVSAAARFIQTRDPGARAYVHEYAQSFQDRMGRPRPRFRRPRGEYHDLGRVLRRQNSSHFAGGFSGAIGWSHGPKGRVRRSLRLGSWNSEYQLIRVHPVLDAPDVPAYVLQFIVFHEMLHAALDPLMAPHERGRHTDEFVERERAHPDHGRTEAWINENLDALLSY